MDWRRRKLDWYMREACGGPRGGRRRWPRGGGVSSYRPTGGRKYMTERVLGPTGSPRRRWTLLLPLAVVALVAAFYIPSAAAVHDFGGLGDGGVFELDNNATDDPTQTGPPPVNAGDD